jgi:predicted small lipoprotein YifL
MRSRSPAQRGARSALVVAFVAALALAATGCGQKGALYLPDRGGEVVTRPMQTPAQVPTTEGPTTEAPAAPDDEPVPGASAPKPPTEPPR